MSLKILLADDSMTAQNMGKKILSDAGYEVIAVSNGAAAVKKIAEQRPDLAILDIYMPGYTGLEVCERVKSTLESSKTPVLLTVGKMEPYRPEDGTRVHADGVIVKPFEASDLLAVVEKFASDAKPSKPAFDADQTVVIPQPTAADFSNETYADWKQSAPADQADETTGPDRFEVPQDMLVSPAMGLEDFGIEPVQTEIGAATEVVTESKPMESFSPDATVLLESAMIMPAGFLNDAIAEVSPSAVEQDALLETTVTAEAPAAEADGESVAQPFEVEFNAASPVAVEESSVLPELEATERPNSFEVAAVTDPTLADPTEYATEFATGFGAANAEEVPVGIISELQDPDDLLTSELEAIDSVEVPAEETHDEFEARVAAAMAAYEAPAAEHQAETASEWKVEEAPLAAEEAEISLEAEMVGSTAVQVEPAPIEQVEVTAEVASSEPVVESFEAAPIVAPAEADAIEAFEAPEVVVEEPVRAEPEHEQVLVAAAAAAGSAMVGNATGTAVDESRIAKAIQRALEKFKPQLVSEIARELASEDKEESN